MKVLKILGIVFLAFVGMIVAGIAIQGISDYFAKRGTTIIFDNGTAQAVTARVDGQEIGTVPAGDLLRTEKIDKPGTHKVEIIGSNGKPVEANNVEIKPSDAKVRFFVYNVQKLNHYALYTIGYGNTKVANPRKPLPDAHFFEIESGAPLGEGFPKTVKVRSGTGGTSWSVVGHMPVHKDRNCCKELRESLK